MKNHWTFIETVQPQTPIYNFNQSDVEANVDRGLLNWKCLWLFHVKSMRPEKKNAERENWHISSWDRASKPCSKDAEGSVHLRTSPNSFLVKMSDSWLLPWAHDMYKKMHSIETES